MLNWAENYQPVIELYQTTDHPALSPEIGHLLWRVSRAHFLGGFCFTTWKTRHQNPPIDWEVGEGGRYACGLAWLIFTTNIVFWWFLQTYMTSGHCSCWFLLVIEQCIFWHYLGFSVTAILCWAAKNSLQGTPPNWDFSWGFLYTVSN